MPSLPNNIEALLLDRSRSITDEDGQIIIPDVIISELHSDSVNVTRHPVDTGANINDHAFKEPAELVVEFGWSDSSALLSSAISSALSFVSSGYPRGLTTTKELYERLVNIQERRELLTVSTGKRQYIDMIITGLKTTTTVDTETCLIVEMTLQQVIRVSSKIVSLETAKQRYPGQTSGVTNSGTRMMNYGDNFRR